MDPITKYYKNLHEQLSSELEILENCLMIVESTDEELLHEGMKKALRSGNKQAIAKEGMRQGERVKRKQESATRYGELYQRFSRTKGPFSRDAKIAAGKQAKEEANIPALMREIEDLDVQLSSMDPQLAKKTTRKYMNPSNLGPDPFPSMPPMAEASEFKSDLEYYKYLAGELKEHLNHISSILYN